jgi:exosortase/archaeosortase family protein
MLIRAWAFLLVFGALQITWEMSRGGVLEHVVIHEATVRPAAALIQLLTPDVHAIANHHALQAPGGGIIIRNGCEGIEALFLLIAAFAVIRLPWRSRLLGIACGAAVVFAANQLRILTLFYAWRADPALFATLHGTVTPIVMLLLIGGYFHAWLNRAAQPAHARL